MKIALKYGSIIAFAVIAWVLISNFVLHLNVTGGVAQVTVLLFNALPITCLFFGINEKRKQFETPFVMGQGIATGASIIIAYILIAGVFFLAMGSRLPAMHPEGQGPVSLFQNFMGFALPALLGGMFYSTIISFIIYRWERRNSV